MNRYVTALFAIMLSIILFSCGASSGTGGAETDLYGFPALDASFNSDDNVNWQEADGWSNGGFFNCTWRAAQVGFDGSAMSLTLDSDGASASPPWKSGEYRTTGYYGYGTYEVRMRPAQNIGTVSSFFTYTGPSDGTTWHEIDIEFLGKDTTEVQFNYFTDGVGNHEYIYDLGFDASTGFHTYGFIWGPGYVTWLVDGDEVYTATDNIPYKEGKIMLNLWPGTGVDSWLGAYNGTVPLTASYDWVKYTPMEAPADS
jgi:beta-glucanase (GH16 family)